ncbi:endothelial cell-selective adhesion molecule-like [Pollicipes pollicipes]|uniref:endothelial cell-selective adhesion molecule-like n=1 Tax=Pollicipes pollicipes TaxID=41117 RepID=UPI0018855BB6|nr:endothelial cell-selective adhesion molecule-like [Pollicipes pollicipes]
MPRSQPARLVYSDMPGIDVDLHGSDDISVRLRQLNMHSTGSYRCEVSAEAPNFDTVSRDGIMVVVVLPEDDPVISGQDEVYGPGSWVSLNCTSERSKPAAQLMWFVNEKRVGDESLVPHKIVRHADGLETSTLGLHIPIRSRSFRSGEMRLTCVSYIQAFNYASATTDVIASYELPRETVVQQRQASFLVRGGAGALLPGTAVSLALLLTGYLVVT